MKPLIDMTLQGVGNPGLKLSLSKRIKLAPLHIGVDFSFDYNMMEVFKFLMVTVVYAHWMACVMVITTNLQESENSFLIPHYSDKGYASFAQLRDEVAPMSLYSASMYWSIMTITTIGYGDITPQTETEELVTCVYMLLGAFHFGYVIGTVGSILNSRNKKRQMFREKLNSLNDFMVGWCELKSVETRQWLKVQPGFVLTLETAD